MQLAKLVDDLQCIAHEGYALYEVDLDLETHELEGYHLDKTNQKLILKSKEVNPKQAVLDWVGSCQDVFQSRYQQFIAAGSEIEIENAMIDLCIDFLKQLI